MSKELNTSIEVEKGELEQFHMPSQAVRNYITDMLAELCLVAKQDGQEDLHVLLKLTYQAVRNAA